MLFRIWQHALMDQPMSVQELWHWVHICYGDELGLTSDDEDYFSPTVMDSKVTTKLVPEGFLEESTQGLGKGLAVAKEEAVDLAQDMVSRDLPSDSSETSETDDDKNQSLPESQPFLAPTTCPVKHEGKMLLNEVVPLSIDELFSTIFSTNKFNTDLMETMKYTDVNVTNWEENATTKLKMRVVNLVAPVSQSVGPKTCQVTETQVMQASSKPGELYVIDVESANSGVPYCDSFYITTHFCLTRASSSESTITAHSQIKYRKSVWGIVKGFIEKNVWAGLEDFYKNLGKALEEECVRKQAGSGLEVTRSRKRESSKLMTANPPPQPTVTAVTPSVTSAPPTTNDKALWAILAVLVVLFLCNVILYYKLTVLEDFDKESRLSPAIDIQLLGEQRSHEEWVSLLQKQALQHQKEMQQWKGTLSSVVSLLRQAEDSITSLQNNIQLAVSEKVASALNTPSEHNEL